MALVAPDAEAHRGGSPYRPRIRKFGEDMGGKTEGDACNDNLQHQHRIEMEANAVARRIGYRIANTADAKGMTGPVGRDGSQKRRKQRLVLHAPDRQHFEREDSTRDRSPEDSSETRHQKDADVRWRQLEDFPKALARLPPS